MVHAKKSPKLWSLHFYFADNEIFKYKSKKKKCNKNCKRVLKQNF